MINKTIKKNWNGLKFLIFHLSLLAIPFLLLFTIMASLAQEPGFFPLVLPRSVGITIIIILFLFAAYIFGGLKK